MTFDTILCFGDSTAAGMDLIPECVDWEQTKKLSFAQKLADKLNINCINYAFPCYSNDRSLRLLPESVLKFPNSLVLFNYTSFNRTEVFTTNPRMPQIVEESYVPLGLNYVNNEANIEHKTLNDIYIKYFYEDTEPFNRYRTYNMLFTVQTICEKYAKNYFQIFLYDDLIHAPDYQKEIYDAIDKSHIIKFDFSHEGISNKHNNEGFGSLTHLNKMKGWPTGVTHHVMQQAHDELAEILYNLVKNDN